MAIHSFSASPDIGAREHSSIKSKFFIDRNRRLSVDLFEEVYQGVCIDFVGYGPRLSEVVFNFF